MNKETDPELTFILPIIPASKKEFEERYPVDVSVGGFIAVSGKLDVYEVKFINESRASLTICPVDTPKKLKIKKPRQDNHWRGGNTKKGGKVGYERR